MRAILTTAAVLLVIGTGCNRPAAGPSISLGGPSGGTTWHYTPNQGSPVPGIDEGSTCYAGRLFLVWSDSTNGTSTNSSGGPTGYTAYGTITTRDGRRIEYRCTSPDGQTGQLVIEGTSYDLANGRLFLVATTGDRLRIKQLSKDLSGWKLESPDFRAIAQADAEIAAFFQPAKP